MKYNVDVKRRNNRCISEPLFLRMDYSNLGTEYQEQRDHDKVINEREKKYML